MRLESLTVQLRARSSWEAMELGMALVRRDAAAIWKPWCLVTLPVFLLINALGWALDLFGLAMVLMWWLKPLFDRVPLYVISRSVFGATPSTRETLRAQWRWGWKPMLHHLTWRRFSPVRAFNLPVDLLEGVQGPRLRERRRVLGSAAYGNAALLTLVCLHFEAALSLGALTAVLMFVPLDMLPETLRTTWDLVIQKSPDWFRFGLNAVAWLSVSIIEPFFIGAGFGLYLNRRTQLEAWDVEIVFRKLRNRLAAGASTLVLAIVLATGLPSAPAHAQQAGPQDEDVTETAADDAESPGPDAQDEDEHHATIQEVFGDHRVDDARFRRAVERAYQDPALNRTQVQKTWERRQKQEPKAKPDLDLGWLNGFTAVFAFIAEWGLWIVVGILVLLLLITARHWWPWMRGLSRKRTRFESDVTREAVTVPESLPDDVAAVAQRLWRGGHRREALALVYRAGVQSMSRHLQITLPPGATEAECLRTSRRLPHAEDRQLFARIVRVWQYAAYAQRLPSEADFTGLLDDLRQRPGWLS